MTITPISTYTVDAGTQFTFAALGDQLIIMPGATLGSTSGSVIDASWSQVTVTVLGSLFSATIVTLQDNSSFDVAAGATYASLSFDATLAGLTLAAGSNIVTIDGQLTSLHAIGIQTGLGNNLVTVTGSVSGASGVYLGLGGGIGDQLINSGSILANTFDDAVQGTKYNNGVFSEGQATQITNLADGIITATALAGAGVRFGLGGGGIVTNAGQITSTQWYGIDFEMIGINSAATLYNSGVIKGMLGSFLGNVTTDTVQNRGTMIGDVQLGNGDDLFDGRWGQVDGGVFAGAGDDQIDLRHGSSSGLLYGGIGRDAIRGGEGDVTISGGDGVDTLTGGSGDDLLAGELNDDVLSGGLGNDTLDAGLSFSIMYGGQGDDVLLMTGAVGTLLSLWTYALGGQGDDTLTGEFQADFLFGGAGDDSLFGKTGGDSLFGGAGDDTLTAFGGGGSAGATINGGIGHDELYSGSGNDVLDGGRDDDTLNGNIGNDLMYGGRDDDTLDGGVGNDTLFGGEGADILYGGVLFNSQTGEIADDSLYGDSDDQLIGGADSDLYFVGSPGDVIVEVAGGGTADRVLAFGSYALAADDDIEVMTTIRDTFTTAINLTGNGLSQVVTGNAGINSLNGAGGDDTLSGLGGADTLNGGTGTDSMIGGTGDDWYFVDTASDTIVEAAGGGTVDRVLATANFTLAADDDIEQLTTTLQAGLTALNLTGNALVQLVIGNAGTNVLNGGGGNDSLTGLAGADQFVFNITLGASNVDKITDFSVADDTIQIDNAVFAGLAAGALGAAAFAANLTGSATTAAHRILYETDTGALFFDADGTGATAKVQFATVTIGTALTSLDFLVI